MVVFGSCQIGLFSALNASSRNCSDLLPDPEVPDDRRVHVGDARADDRVPSDVAPGADALSAYASVLNQRAIVRWSLGRSGSCPVTFGRSWPPPVFDRSVPTQHVSRKSARHRDDRAHLPAAEDRRADAALAGTACRRRTAARRGSTRRSGGARRTPTDPTRNRGRSCPAGTACRR